MIIIYALSDPRNDEIRYIGKTNNIKKRVRDHLSLKEKNFLKNNWLKNLKNEGLKPNVLTLEITTEELWKEREIFYIKHYKEKYNKLTNMTDGGEGVTFTPEIRDRLSKKLISIGHKPSKEALEKSMKSRMGKELSLEHRNRISKSLVGTVKTEEQKIKNRNRMLGKKMSESSKEKLSRSRMGYVWREESKDKLRKNILKLDTNGVVITEYKGITTAAKEIGGDISNIWRCLNNQRKTAYGYKWKYKSDMVNREKKS